MATCAFVLCGLETARCGAASTPVPVSHVFHGLAVLRFRISTVEILRRMFHICVAFVGLPLFMSLTPTHFGSGAGGLDEVVIRAWTSISTSLFIEDLSAVGSWELYDGLGALGTMVCWLSDLFSPLGVLPMASGSWWRLL